LVGDVSRYTFQTQRTLEIGAQQGCGGALIVAKGAHWVIVSKWQKLSRHLNHLIMVFVVYFNTPLTMDTSNWVFDVGDQVDVFFNYFLVCGFCDGGN